MSEVSSNEAVGTKVRKGNPFRGIYIPPTPDDIIGPALRKAKSISPKISGKKDPILQKKAVVITRIKVFSEELSNQLIEIVKRCPSIEKMHPFYLAAMEIWLSKDSYKKALAKIHGASKVIRKITRNCIFKIKSVRKDELTPTSEVLKQIDKLRREAYGRLSSVVKSLKKELNILAEIVKKMKRVPDYDPALPTVVVAGPPNTGKSSFVKTVSNAKVEIAPYPFTTKNITFGHLEYKFGEAVIRRVQIVDTPGLFDRPLEERKEPELLALNAIKHLADIVLFLFDGSHEAAVNVDEQIRIFETVKNFFGSAKPLIIAINKIDIADEKTTTSITEYLKANGEDEPILISIKEKINIDVVLRKILDFLNSSQRA
ncbi:MAG: NOG1 family protein [Candidatus Njordarchaeales archaeon]